MPKSNGSIKRSVLAGAIGGIVAVAVVAILAAILFRRIGPSLMPRMMKRMMSEGGCSEEMRACMEKCGCGRPETADGADRS
jgi:hypothetical protein